MTPAPARTAAPLRFLALVVGGWICLRAALLAPIWGGDGPGANGAILATEPAARPVQHDSRPPTPALAMAARRPPPASGLARVTPLISDAAYKRVPRRGALAELYAALAGPARSAASAQSTPSAESASAASGESAPPPAPQPTSGGAVSLAAPSVSSPLRRVGVAPRLSAGSALPPEAIFSGHWSGSAWLLARREEGARALAPGGTLGGSQAGARLLYRVNGDPARPLALTGRAYLPLHRVRGAEAAVGIDWQPIGRLPVHLLAERRQALGEEGRSAFAVTVYGGIGRTLPLGFRVDAYGQAGVVGVRARDLFADGAARIAAPLGRVELGGTLRGAAQPGAARLDAGPEISLRLHAGPAALRLSADWRFRIAGEAAPDSGPALTLAVDF